MAAASAQNPHVALTILARRLLERELLTVVHAVGKWTDLDDEVMMIARQRPMPAQVPVLWRSWQAFPRREPVVELLVEMADRYGMERATTELYAGDALGWLKEKQPIDAVVRWTRRRRIAWDELSEMPESPFKADTPLIRQVFHRTLQIGSRQQLLAMPQETVLDGWSQMSGERHADACANFLERVEPEMWQGWEKTLESVRESYGMPGAQGTTSMFWKRVSEERRAAFRRHFVTLELEIAFEGDATPDRRSFWMSQRGKIVSVRHGTAGETRWSLIDFPGFSVIEFFEVGNAAYLYPVDHEILRKIKSGRRMSQPSELKKVLHSDFAPHRDNWIIHHSGNWQYYASKILDTWRARFPRP